MYSIGEFSKIGSVTTKTLRYYDEIGLLPPAYVDEESHYRYYNTEQVEVILLINELKQYDLKLEQIKAILEKDDLALLAHFLEERVHELENEIDANLRLKASIEKKMQHIQLGGKMMDKISKFVVEAKVFEPMQVIGKVATIEITQMGKVLGDVFAELYQGGLRPAGPVMTFYHDESFEPQHATIEVCVQIEDTEVARANDKVKTLQPGMCAICTHVGPYDQLGGAYAAILKWMEENGYKTASAPFDIYMNDPQVVKNPEELITKVCFPITK